MDACSCVPNRSLALSYITAANIFIGKALKVQHYENPPQRMIEFEVQIKFKGTFPASNKIIISTPRGSNLCGLEINAGQRWQVWARNFTSFLLDQENANRQEPILSAYLCDETTKDIFRNIEFLLNPPTNLS
jgi:hypothetical protein